MSKVKVVLTKFGVVRSPNSEN